MFGRVDQHALAVVDDVLAGAVGAVAFGAAARHEEVAAARDAGGVGGRRHRHDAAASTRRVHLALAELRAADDGSGGQQRPGRQRPAAEYLIQRFMGVLLRFRVRQRRQPAMAGRRARDADGARELGPAARIEVRADDARARRGTPRAACRAFTPPSMAARSRGAQRRHHPARDRRCSCGGMLRQQAVVDAPCSSASL